MPYFCSSRLGRYYFSLFLFTASAPDFSDDKRPLSVEMKKSALQWFVLVPNFSCKESQLFYSIFNFRQNISKDLVHSESIFQSALEFELNSFGH